MFLCFKRDASAMAAEQIVLPYEVKRSTLFLLTVTPVCQRNTQTTQLLRVVTQ